MRRLIAIGILACLVLSYIPAIAEDSGVEENKESQLKTPSRLLDDSELTLGQVEALNSVGMGRGANTNWSAAGGSGNDDEIYEMQLDSQGNVIICGTIYQVSTFGAIQVDTEGEGDILIAKLSSSGTWEWAVSAGTALYYDECRGLTIDSNDNVYGTGYFQGSVSFGNTTITTTGFDGWLARVDSTGSWDWAMKFGGFDVDVGWDLVADNYDNLYVTGYYQNFTEFDATQLSAEAQSEDARFFIAYYNFSSAVWDWAKDSDGNGISLGFQLVHEPSTNAAYVVGYNTGYEEFSSNFTSNPASTWAGILLKFNDNGGMVWGTNVGGNNCPIGLNCGVYFNNIVLHPDGGVVVGGNYLIDYKTPLGNGAGRGSWDLLVIHYAANGTMQWKFDAGSADDDRIQSLSVNPKGEVQFGGNHLESLQFPFYTLNKSNSNQKYDGFIAQLDPDGDFQWALSIGGADNDTVGALIAKDDGTIISGGDFSGTVYFGNTPRSATDQDIFVWVFQHDKDDDGVTDYTDNCLNTANSNQSNYDNDVKGDACDTDDDNDGLHDALDDCQYGFMDWNQSNTSLDYDQDGCNDLEEDDDDDGDGYNDSSDNCPKGVLDWESNATSDLDSDGCRDIDEDDDDDGDTVLDSNDNCQYLPNVGQENYDSDLFGDDCDSDDDNDGLDDIFDNCSKGATNWTSALQTDKDGDGCEDEGSNEDLDDDNDGLLDEFDSCPRGDTGWTSSPSLDRDGDGCRNDNEDNDNDNDSVINEIDNCPKGITNWRKNSTNDNDGDGCLDDREDNDNDNDGFANSIDICPTQEGAATLGGMRGCPDFDEDGWADSSDAFVQDGTQWMDGDGDGYGDNPNGNSPDACPFYFGNSTADRLGCVDDDGDGYSNPDLMWTVSQGADAFVDEPSQWADFDSDGYGDNFDGLNVDYCTEESGSSFEDRFGCPDLDSDGWSDADAFWTDSKWESLGFGPDAFPMDSTQWYDTDEDGFGDNWGNSSWNETRNETWPGIWVDGATGDMCPLERNEGLFIDDSRPGCIVEEDDGNTGQTDKEDSTSSSEGISLMTLVAIVAGIIVMVLVVVVTVLLKAGGKKSKPRKKNPIDLTLEQPAGVIDEVANEVTESEPNTNEETVASWDLLPAGDYLDPDENGTNWFKTNEGEHWSQNPDGSWTKWNN